MPAERAGAGAAAASGGEGAEAARARAAPHPPQPQGAPPQNTSLPQSSLSPPEMPPPALRRQTSLEVPLVGRLLVAEEAKFGFCVVRRAGAWPRAPWRRRRLSGGLWRRAGAPAVCRRPQAGALRRARGCRRFAGPRASSQQRLGHTSRAVAPPLRVNLAPWAAWGAFGCRSKPLEAWQAVEAPERGHVRRRRLAAEAGPRPRVSLSRPGCALARRLARARGGGARESVRVRGRGTA